MPSSAMLRVIFLLSIVMIASSDVAPGASDPGRRVTTCVNRNLPRKRTAYLVFLALTGVEKVVPEHPVSTADGVSPEGLNVVPEGATAKSATAKKVVALIKQMLKQKQGALRKRQAAEQAQQVICSAPQDRSQSMRSGRCQKLRRKDARATIVPAGLAAWTAEFVLYLRVIYYGRSATIHTASDFQTTQTDRHTFYSRHDFSLCGSFS